MATATDLGTNHEPGIGTLLKGIVGDVTNLIKQEAQFARREIQNDLKKTGKASVLLVVGAAVSFLAVIVLTFMMVHLLHWATAPAGTTSGLPLWACHAIVGVAFLLVGGLMILAGVKKFQSFNPLPDQTAESIKENVEWITNSK